MLENISIGLSVMVIGLGTVFAVLLLLMGILYLFGVVYKINEKKKAQATQSAQPQEVAPAQATPAQSENLTDDSELVAVITAAIAASLNTSTYKLKIASIRRTNAGPAWNKQTFTNNL